MGVVETCCAVEFVWGDMLVWRTRQGQEPESRKQTPPKLVKLGARHALTLDPGVRTAAFNLGLPHLLATPLSYARRFSRQRGAPLRD